MARPLTAVSHPLLPMSVLPLPPAPPAMPPEQMRLLQTTLHDMKALLEVDAAVCFLNHGAELMLMVADGLPELTADQQQSLFHCLQTIAHHSTPLIQHTPIHQYNPTRNPYCTGKCICGHLAYQTILFAPIIQPEGATQLISGNLSLYSHAERTFTPSEQQVVMMMGRQLGLALERIHLLEAEREARAQAEVLQEVGNVLNSNLELTALVEALLEQMERVIPLDSANLAMIENGRAIVVGSRGYEQFTIPVNGIELDLSQFPNLTQLLHSDTPLYIPDTQNDPNWKSNLKGAEHIQAWLGAPIRVDGQTVAILSADKIHPYFYQPTHLQLITTFANQAALALRNAQLFAKRQMQTQQMHLLHHFSKRLTGLMTVQEVCMAACEHLCEKLGYSTAALFTTTPPHNELRYQATQATSPWAVDLLPEADHPLLIRALTQQQPLIHHPTTPTALAELTLPLSVGQEMLGVLHVTSAWVDGFHTADLDLLRIMAGQLAIALEKTRFFEETVRQASELRILFGLSAALRTASSLEQILDIVVNQSQQAMRCAGSSIMLVEPHGRDLTLRACVPPNPTAIGTRYTFGKGIVGHVARTQRPYTAPDIWRDPLTHIPEQDRARINTARASLSVPLQTQDQLVGVLNVWFTETHYFTHENEAFMVAMAEIAGNAIHRATVLATLEQRVEERTQELELANSQLQRLDALKTRFVSEVSHELRTPIANLTLYIDLFKRSQGKPDRQQKYMEVLEKQASRLGGLVENVLYLSRLDLAKEQVVLSAVDLNEVIEEVLSAQYVRAEELGLELVYEAKSYTAAKNPWQEGTRPFQILGERNQLAQMLTHLVHNALSYTPHGHVHLTLAPDGPKQLLLEIRDTGVGIPPEEWDDLFKRFYRGQSATQLNLPGNGLGLAIADEIVKIHKGRIDFTSEVGVGSTFRIWLPTMRVY